jgi:HK97 family phage prohead protease
MILRYSERGILVTKDLAGEELLQVVKDRTDPKGKLKSELVVFKGMQIFTKIPDAESEIFPWVYSSDDRDRMGDRVVQDWILDNYKKNPVVLWAHDHRTPAIGYSESIKVDTHLGGNIRFNKTEFDPFGASIAARVRFGTLRAGSVGFMPCVITRIEEEIEGKHYVTGYELSQNDLWEFSICNVPANPLALYGGKIVPATEPQKEEDPPRRSIFVPIGKTPPVRGGLKMFIQEDSR